MKEFLVFLIKELVDKPEKIEVTENETDGSLILSVRLDREDMGKVIGKEGKIIHAIRNLLKVRGVKEGKLVRVELLEA